MAEIALPRHQATQSQSQAIGSPLYQRRQASNAGPVELLPNPDFSFPMRPADDAPPAPSASDSRPMSLQVYPTGRRGSMPHQRQKSVNALPEFSFNPAGAPPLPTAAAASSSSSSSSSPPPQSPPALPTTPTKQVHGHRRGGSEFIGGDARPGGVSMMSSSPTKGSSVSSSQTNLHPGPPAGRRGHAHRRSGAISSHDLSSIMNPPAPARAGSAPVTPSEGNNFQFGHTVNKSFSQPSLRKSGSDEEISVRPPSRARVGFSDRVEIIRPLSTISSETETSMSTIRGHSAANSLSSIVGGVNSSPQLSRTGRAFLTTVEDESRPSTAGAVLEQFMASSLTGEPLDRKRPMSAISPTSPTAPTGSSRIGTKRRGFFRLEPRRSDNSVHTLASSASDPSLSRTLDSPLQSPATDDEEPVEDMDKAKPAKDKANRKPRKVKSWANSFIPRKNKQSKKVAESPSAVPSDASPEIEDTDASEDLDFEPNFDDDTTVTLVSPTEASMPLPQLDTNYASWQPRQLQRVDSDMMSPVIDLDAALGPFNTPNPSSPRNQQRGFSAHRRAMHSANGLTVNHRRTESAPELVPFEYRSSTVAATSPMADVFEEEEPEEEDVVVKKETPVQTDSEVSDESPEPKIEVVEADAEQIGAAITWNFADGLGIDRPSRARDAIQEEALSPCAIPESISNDEIVRSVPESPAVEVVEDFEEPRTSSLTHSSDSTVTAPADEPKEPRPVLNMSFHLPQQNLMTPDTITSTCTSPDLRSSQASFDTPRVGTAASSVSDYPVMPSPRFGEPGPELRVSVDDVPSLTSSRSTMTSAMHNGYALPLPRRPGERSTSLSSASSDLETRRRKRSSIASLSRLINSSSHGERSKLSIEQRPQSAHLEPVKDKKKHKRLSKLKFWKSRDSSSMQS